MRINIYEFLALFSLLAVGCSAGWCFKGVWNKEVDYMQAEKRISLDEKWEDWKVTGVFRYDSIIKDLRVAISHADMVLIDVCIKEIEKYLLERENGDRGLPEAMKEAKGLNAINNAQLYIAGWNDYRMLALGKPIPERDEEGFLLTGEEQN